MKATYGERSISAWRTPNSAWYGSMTSGIRTASLLIEQGAHPKYIQEQMGHSSIQVTMDIYEHGICVRAAIEGGLRSWTTPGWRANPQSRNLPVQWERGTVSKWLIKMVAPTRIERATRGLGNRCSIQLSYGATRSTT